MVVTGVGLISSVGIGTEESWAGVKAGKNGLRRITAFDPTGFNCQIAGEVDGFDPLQFLNRKEVRKVGRFILFAIAASDFATQSAKLEVPQEGVPEPPTLKSASPSPSSSILPTESTFVALMTVVLPPVAHH